MSELTYVEFHDQASGRKTRYVFPGNPYGGWLMFQHPDGQWVTLREATQDDLAAIHREVADRKKELEAVSLALLEAANEILERQQISREETA